MLLIRKLFQKSQIVLVKRPDIADLMSEDRDALDTQSPRETGDLLGVVTNGFEDRRMHHPTTAELDPTSLLAHRAAGAVALPAADVDFRARLRVGEKARSKPHACVCREHLAHERQQRALEVR